MKVAIIGATGFLGSALTKRFATDGHSVSGFDVTEPKFLGKGVSYSSLDVLKQVIDLPSGTDAVFYLAQSPHYRDFPEQMDQLFGVNTFGLIKAAKASYERNVKFFCHASTGNVYSPSFQPLNEEHPIRRDNPYVLSKLMAEEMLDLLNGTANFLSLRLFGLFGPGQRGMLPSRIQESIMNRQKIYIEPSPIDPKDDGGLRVSFMFVEDTAECLVRLAQLAIDGASLPARLNVAGEKAITIRRFAETVGQIVGVNPILEKTEHPRKFDLIADISRLIELVQPKFTPFEEAITKTITLQ